MGSGYTRCHAHMYVLHVAPWVFLVKTVFVTFTLPFASHSCLFLGLGSRSSGGERGFLLALAHWTRVIAFFMVKGTSRILHMWQLSMWVGVGDALAKQINRTYVQLQQRCTFKFRNRSLFSYITADFLPPRWTRIDFSLWYIYTYTQRTTSMWYIHIIHNVLLVCGTYILYTTYY